MDISVQEEKEFSIHPTSEVWKLEERTRLQILKERIANILGRQTEVLQIPKVTIDVYYGSHVTEADAERMFPNIKTCDIFIPEMLGWSKKRLEIVNKVSAGKMSPRDAAYAIGYKPWEGPFDFRILNMVYKTNKPIAYVDYPRSDPRMQEYLDANNRMKDITQYWVLGPSFPGIIRSIKAKTQEAALKDEERERYMLSNIQTAIENALDNNPKLRQQAKRKGELKILMQLGAGHTSISHLLSKSNTEISSNFSVSPFIFGYGFEGIRRYRMGKEFDDEFAAKMLGEGLLSAVFYEQLVTSMPTNEEREVFFRKLASTLTYQDVEKIVEENPDGLLKPLRDYLLRLVRQKTPELDNALGINQAELAT